MRVACTSRNQKLYGHVTKKKFGSHTNSNKKKWGNEKGRWKKLPIRFAAGITKITEDGKGSRWHFWKPEGTQGGEGVQPVSFFQSAGCTNPLGVVEWYQRQCSNSNWIVDNRQMTEA